MADQELPTMDAKNLYREEIYTDGVVGSIRVMIPVKSDNSADSDRETIYQGSTQMMTPAGALPLNFDIEANSLLEACEGFAGAAQAAMEATIKELQELRRQQASSIVVPGSGGSGAMPRGGIQIP